MENELKTKVATLLADAKIPFRQDVAVGGLVPDITLRSPKGHTIVLDLNERAPGARGLKLASRQAERYKKVIGIDGAYIVVNGLLRSKPEEGLLSPDDFVDFVFTELNKPPELTGEPVLMNLKPPKATVFIAMPFAEEYDDAFVAIVNAIKSAGAASKRTKEEHFAGFVMPEVERLINESVGVVADLSEAKPNVVYELGFARGAGKSVVAVSSTKELPFDVAQLNYLEYRKGQTNKLTQPLAERLKSVLKL